MFLEYSSKTVFANINMNKNDLRLPHDNLLLSPQLWINHSTINLLEIFDELTSETKNQELLETVAGEELLRLQQLVVGQFYRKTLDKKFPYWKAHRKIKPIINVEVELWESIYKMLEQMYCLKIFTPCPAHSLFALIREKELVLVIKTYSGGQLVVKDYLSSLQYQNRQLKSCENPFNRQISPFTWEIMTPAIAQANRDDEFRKKFYMPVVDARQRLTGLIKKERFRAYYEGKIQRQGRRKECLTSIDTEPN